MNRTVGKAGGRAGSHVRAPATPAATPTARIAASGQARRRRSVHVGGTGVACAGAAPTAGAAWLPDPCADPVDSSADVARKPVRASSSSPALA